MRRLAGFLSTTVLTYWLGQCASAVPINYTVNLVVNPFDSGDPLGLAGANVTLLYGIDTTMLTPTFDGPVMQADQATVWPDTNTTASLTISGSTSADGTYVSSLVGGTTFQFFDNGNIFFGSFNGKDVVQFPNANFSVLSQDVEIAGLVVAQDDSFNTPSDPIQAYPFAAADVTMAQNPTLMYFGGPADSSQALTTGLMANAQAVPEPSTLALAACAALGIVIARRCPPSGREHCRFI